jgi:Spy/CpxP family protein refolding chaperone
MRKTVVLAAMMAIMALMLVAMPAMADNNNNHRWDNRWDNWWDNHDNNSFGEIDDCSYVWWWGQPVLVCEIDD